MFGENFTIKAVEMELLDFLLGVLSILMQMAAVVITITFSVSFYSSGSESLESPKAVGCCLLYLFGSAILLYFGTRSLMEVAFAGWRESERLLWFVGTGALAAAVVLNLLCGSLIAIVYLSTRRNLLLTLRRVLHRMRSHIHEKMKR